LYEKFLKKDKHYEQETKVVVSWLSTTCTWLTTGKCMLVEIAAICDDNPASEGGVTRVKANFAIPWMNACSKAIYRCVGNRAAADIVILCPRQNMAITNILVEKPFAATRQEADAMIRPCNGSSRKSW